MSPRRASVNEEMRRRSRDRLLQATIDLVSERGHEKITLGDIADRAGVARGLVSYYFPSKRHLLQAAMQQLLCTALERTLTDTPPGACPRERLARAIDCVLGLVVSRPALFRSHLATVLAPETEEFVEGPEQQALFEVAQRTVAGLGGDGQDPDYPMLRTHLTGAVVRLLLPGSDVPLVKVRAELFQRYGLDWEQGLPTTTTPSGPVLGPDGGGR
ncbi:TetR/AcrR family transcriptional regulator [Streptomyces capparidis]